MAPLYGRSMLRPNTMPPKSKPLEIHDNPAASRYETVIVEYLLTGPNITFSHTEVPEELEGQGVAS